MFLLFGGFIFFIQLAKHKGEKHAREIIAEVGKGAKAKIDYPKVQILKEPEEEITTGFAIVGNASAVVIVNEANGAVTAKLHPLSSDVMVVTKPTLNVEPRTTRDPAP